MKKLDIVMVNPDENDVGKTVTYESNNVAKLLEVFINNIVYLNVSEDKINYSIAIYLTKLKDKNVVKKYYEVNKYIIDIILNIEEALMSLSQTYQDENDVDKFDNELYYINNLEEVRNKLLFAVIKKVPELADDLLNSISVNNKSITYDNSSDSSKK